LTARLKTASMSAVRDAPDAKVVGFGVALAGRTEGVSAGKRGITQEAK
jgi:hypothetical protein